MSYIGSTPTTQSFIAGTDYFNGTGSQVAFTLSRSVNSVNDIEVIVNNVEQIPSGYSVSGTTLTFSAAPSAGTSNVYVRYLSTTNLSLAIPAGTSASFNTVGVSGNLAFTGTGNRITGDFSNGTVANRVAFQTSTVNGATNIAVIPNGTSTTSLLQLHTNSADLGNSSMLQLGATTTSMNLYAGRTGTGTFLPMAFYTGGSERVMVDTSGNVGIGTSSPAHQLHISGPSPRIEMTDTDTGADCYVSAASGTGALVLSADENNEVATSSMAFRVDGTERARIDDSGVFLVGKAAADITVIGAELKVGSTSVPAGVFTGENVNGVVLINRQSSDGTLIAFRQANTVEGIISVSGTTVSYVGGHLSRWAQTTTAKDESLVKGTVLSNLDAMNVYVDAEGNPVPNEQLNKVKVSDVEGDANVAGVFVNWTHDEDHNIDEINMAMTGDLIIRIAQGTTVARGDLLMSAGDGTAKPQGDDIVRSKTVAKVTSTHVTCTYADGSYCVPCVLMAC